MKSRTLFAAIAALVMLCACSLPASAQVRPSDSGYFRINVFTACNVLIDKIAAGAYCVHRVNVMCMQNGLPFVGGDDWPVVQSLPLTFDLYRPQSGFAPVGSITINALGEPANIVLNGETGTWHKVGAYTGSDTCLQPRPPATRPTLCGEFGWFCG